MESATGGFLDILGPVTLVTGLLILANSIWIGLSLRISRTARTLYRAINTRLPYWLGPLDQILLCGAVVGLTALVLSAPGLGPWAPFVTPPGGSSVSSTALLAAAAALLALLLFAATHARGAEQEARAGGKYLGRPVSSSQLARSPWALLLRLPIFQAMTVLLFLLPLARTPSFPGLPGSVLGLDLSAIPPMWILLSAIWCAVFFTVGAVLIAHASTALRTSLIDAMDPLGVQDQIRRDIKESADRAWRRQLSPRRRSHAFDVEDWTSRCITFSTALPDDEQVVYLHATVARLSFHSGTWSQLDASRRDLKLAAALASRARRSDSGMLVTRWFRSALTWLSRRVADRAARRVASIESAHLGRAAACVRALQDKNLDVRLRAEIIKCIMASATEIDQAYSSFGRTIDRISFDLLEAIGDPREELLGRENELPSLGPAMPRPWDPESSSPHVLAVPLAGITGLASALFPTDYSEQSGSSAAGTTVRELLTRVGDLRHEPTRDIALSGVVKAILECVVLHRSETEEIDIDVLSALLPRARDGMPHTISNGRSTLAGQPHRSLPTVIEDCAFAVLMNRTDLEPERTRALLDLVGTTERVCALLFDLTYSIVSGRSLTARSLAPFFLALRFRDLTNEDSHADALNVTVRAFDSSFARQILSKEEIRFLLGSLDHRLSLGLCAGFQNLNSTRHGQGLRMTQFIQWHLVAASSGAVFSRSCTDPGAAVGAAVNALAESAASLWRFHDEWRSIDRYSAGQLEYFLTETVGPPAHED